MHSSQIHVALVVSRLNHGGTEVQVLELARELSTQNYKITLLVFYPKNQLWEMACGIQELECISLGKKSRWDIFFLIRFVLLLRKIKPQIIYSFLPTANIVSLIARPFIPQTKLVWGIRASNMDFHYFDTFSKAIWKVECLLSRFVTTVVANSVAGKLYGIRHGLNENKTQVIHNGIDTGKFTPDKLERMKVRNQWGVADSELLVGIVGRFDPMKDHRTFLEAAHLVVKKRKNIKFILVGVGEAEGNLKEEFSKGELEGKLLFTGIVENPLIYFQAMDLFCSSSVTEGFSNAIAEAMATGVSCVVTDVGDSKKIVGETGWVVPPSNPKELAEGILLQLSRLDLAQVELAEAARARIVKNFSRPQLGNQIHFLFEQLLERH